MAKKKNELPAWILSEAAFFIALCYILYLLKVQANLLASSFILWALINISILACPFLRKFVCK